jgi:23S rRNA (adenine2503-C2)-methyltransferase
MGACVIKPGMSETPIVTPAAAPVAPNIFDLPYADLENLLKSQGKEKFRAHQLFKWIYEKKVFDPSLMSNLGKQFRQDLAGLFTFTLPPMVQHNVSQDGTQKFLFEVAKGMTVESVLIPADDRNTLCVSSEVGCNMACTFCFTGKQKLKRRLTVSEIVGQYIQAAKIIGSEKRITNIVFMGMGEPLDNCDNVFNAIKILIDDRGINFSRRKITVSTSGLVPQIPLVTESGVRLAISLNAPNDAIRDVIMPINKKYPLKALLAACKTHAEESRDRVTFEYVLLKGINDDIEHAQMVYSLIKNIPCKLNLIPFNEHPDSGYTRPESRKVYHFQSQLLNKGIHTTIRRTMGRDIFAACGQLTSLYKEKPMHQDVATGVLG